MKLKKAKKPSIETTFHYCGEALNFSMDTDILTPNFIEKMTRLSKEAAKVDKESKAEKKAKSEENTELKGLTLTVEHNEIMAQTLTRVIVSWDMEGDNDEILPICVETFKNLPLALLIELFQFVTQVANPEPQTGPNSAAS